MKIPLVGIPEAPGAQRSFAPLSVTTYDQVGQAGARLGNIVEGVATDLPVRIKTAIDQGTLAKLETNQEAYFQDTVDKIRTGPDANNPDKWLDHWKDAQTNFTDKATDDDGIKSLSFAARREYQVSMAKWSAMTTQQVGHMATNKAIENAGANHIAAYHSQLMVGDESGAVRQIQQGIASGTIKPEVGLPLIAHAPAENEYNQATKFMSVPMEQGGGPIALEKALQAQDEKGNFVNYTHIHGDTRTQLQLHAHRVGAEVQSNNLQGVLQDLDNNPNDPAALQRARQMAGYGGITQQALKGIETGITRANLKEAKNTSDLVTMMVHDHDFTADKDPEGAARGFKDQIASLPVSVRKPIWDQIDNKVAAAKKAGVAAEKPVEKDIYDRMKEDRVENGTFIPMATVQGEKGFLGFGAKPDSVEHIPGGLKALQGEGAQGLLDKDIEAKFGAGTTRQQVLAAEQLHYAQQMTKMRSWFAGYRESHGGKDAPEDEAEAYRQSLTAPYVMAAVKQALGGASPAPAARQLSAADQEARVWAETHANDPRAAKILERLK